jgi:hypothetical protein
MAVMKITRSNACGCCGKELTDPISVAIGIGPECIKSVKIDQEALASALASSGFYEYEYDENDPKSMKFHSRMSTQKLIVLDNELAAYVATNAGKCNIDHVLAMLENAAETLHGSDSLSKSRAASLVKTLDKVKASFGSQLKLLFDNSLDFDNLDLEDLINKFNLADHIKQRFDNSVNTIFSGNVHCKLIDYADDKCVRLCRFSEGSISFMERCIKYTSEAGMDKRSGIFQGYLTQSLLAAKQSQQEEDEAFETLDATIIGGVASKYDSYYKFLKPGRKSYDYLRANQDTIVQGLILRMQSNFEKESPWSVLETDIRPLCNLGSRLFDDENYVLEKVLSDPRLIESFNNAVVADGKDWSSGLRRCYGSLKGKGLWDIITGKKQAA